jgi:hypothetical protein
MILAAIWRQTLYRDAVHDAVFNAIWGLTKPMAVALANPSMLTKWCKR